MKPERILLAVFLLGVGYLFWARRSLAATVDQAPAPASSAGGVLGGATGQLVFPVAPAAPAFTPMPFEGSGAAPPSLGAPAPKQPPPLQEIPTQAAIMPAPIRRSGGGGRASGGEVQTHLF